MSEALAWDGNSGVDELKNLDTQDLGSTGHSRLANVAHLSLVGWRREASPLLEILQRPHLSDFPWWSGVNKLPSNAGDVDSILIGNEIPHAAVQPLSLGMATREKPSCYNAER